MQGVRVKVKQIVLAIAIAAAVLLVVVAFRGEDVSPGPSSHESMGKSDAPASTSPDVVLRITPGAVPRSTVPKAHLDPAMQEWLEARDLKSLYDRLSTGPRTPEQTWILAMILERCATYTDRKAQPQAPSAAEARARGRERFIASLSDKDPGREKRIAAYDQVTVDKCASLRDLKTTGAQCARAHRCRGRRGRPEGAPFRRPTWTAGGLGGPPRDEPQRVGIDLPRDGRCVEGDRRDARSTGPGIGVLRPHRGAVQRPVRSRRPPGSPGGCLVDVRRAASRGVRPGELLRRR